MSPQGGWDSFIQAKFTEATEAVTSKGIGTGITVLMKGNCKGLTDTLYLVAKIFFETLVHVLKGNIGAGLFAMGDAFKHAGFVIGTVGTAILGFICVYNMHVLVRLARAVRFKKRIPWRPTFPDTITFCFELGPPKLRRLCKTVAVTMKTFIAITQLGFCVVYISLVGETISNIIQYYYPLSVRVCIVMTFPAILISSLIHTLKFLAPISAVSTAFLFYAYAVSMVYSTLDLPDISTRKLIEPVSEWPLFAGTVIFCFEGIALVIPLKNEMKQPEKFDKTFGPLNIGMVTMASMLITLGFMSYLRFGQDVADSVTFNLPHNWIGISAQSVFALGILFTYPIQFYVVAKLFMKDLKRKWGPFKKPLLVELALRTALVIVTYVVAVTIPYIALVLSLIGAVCSNALALFFPAAGDLCLRFGPITEEEVKEDYDVDSADMEEMPNLDKNIFRLFMDGASLLFFVLGCTFGLYAAVERIVKEFIKEVHEGIK